MRPGDAKSRRGTQTGLTLVELMVAMVIGLLLLAGIMQVLITSQHSHRLQNGLSLVQENGRFITEYLGRHIRTAGDPAWYFASDEAEDTGDWPIEYSNGALTIRYQHTEDCLGHTVGSAGERDGLEQPLAVSTFYVDSETEQLMCVGNGDGSAEPLIRGVDAVRYRFGEDTNGNGSANVYRHGDDVTDWSRVVSVRVGLLLNTVDEAGVRRVRTFQLLGQQYEFNDGRPRQIFVQTIKLRNRGT